jgi:hypothetical protein
MAVVVGSVQEAFGFTEAVGPSLQVVSSAKKVQHCFVTVIWPTGTYAQADDANFAPATVIQNERRNNKTITILQAAFVSPGDENGATVGAGACSNSAGTITCPLIQADMSTERANGAVSATWNRPITFCVSYYESIA